MMVKIFGALLIVFGCAGVGYSMAAAHKRTEIALQALITAVEFMVSELQFRLTALPVLCEMTSEQIRGSISEVFLELSAELAKQTSPDATKCMETVLDKTPDLSPMVKDNLLRLGQSLGRFDLPGQISGLKSVQEMVNRDLQGLRSNRDIRLRGYATLSLCAGTALVILFI